MSAHTLTEHVTAQGRTNEGPKSAHALHRELVEVVRDLDDKRTAVQALAALYPHLTPRWFTRHFARLTTLPDVELARVLTHSDLTGETAARRADALARVEAEVDPLGLLSRYERRRAAVERIARRRMAAEKGGRA